MSRILGVDPGSRTTGFALLEAQGRTLHYLDSGAIRTGDGELPARLKVIFTELRRLIDLYTPDTLAIEQVFMHRNADSALKLGQARGAAICAATVTDMAIYEYTPTEVKQALVGHGHADKSQVQHMVTAILRLNGTPQADAADALAIAICHAHSNTTLTRLQQQQTVVAHRYRRYR